MKAASPSLVLVLLLVLVIESPAEQSLPDLTVVIYNKNVSDSVQLAKFYADQRGIARDHLVGLDCSAEEEISRDEYDGTIANPLREIFRARNWWTLRGSPGENATITATAIRFVSVIKGVPLKIRATSNYSGDVPGEPPVGNRNEASVDSELAVLGLFSRQISGARSNPYFQNFRAIREFDNPVLLLVCRLDAPTADLVRRMITEAISTEKAGLWGRAYVDGAHNTTGNFAMGDEWLRTSVDQLRKVGVPVVYDDKPETLPDGFPVTDAALYYGWYNANVSGPFARPDFHFVPGAIAVHIHSFSADTLRNANAGWVAPLMAKGAAASIGNVYEPYLQLTPHLDIFNDRLLHGFTFAESVYMSVRVLSWMTAMVGDPLYRPFASWLQLDSNAADNDWERYHAFALKNATCPSVEFRALAWKTAVVEHNCPMLEDLAAVEAVEGDLAVATAHFPQARRCYRNRADVLRVTMEEASALAKQNGLKRALQLVRAALQNAPDAPAAALLRKMEADLARGP
jgi:uncharacterized protein (TIGR03790 family)